MNQRLQDIMEAVSAGFAEQGIDVAPSEFLDKNRSRRVSWPRQVVFFMARQYLRLPYQDIGKQIGKHNHASVIHGERMAVNNIESDHRYGLAYQRSCSLLGVEPPDWLHVKTDPPVKRKEEALPTPISTLRTGDGQIEPMQWDPEGLRALKAWRREGSK